MAADTAGCSTDYNIITGRLNTTMSSENEDSLGNTLLGNEIKERFTSMRTAFLKLDKDRDGRISVNEIRKMCKEWNIPTSEADRLLDKADVDDNGTLDFNEFAKRFDPDVGQMSPGTSPTAQSSAYGATYKARDDRPCGGSGAYNMEGYEATEPRVHAATKIQSMQRGRAARSQTTQKKQAPASKSGTRDCTMPPARKGNGGGAGPVLVYGQSGCTSCRVACAVLDDAGVAYELRDASVDNSYEDALRASGFNGGKFGLPVVVIGKKAFWDFDNRELPSMLEAAGVQAQPPERSVRVYGEEGCSNCAAVHGKLDAAGVPYERRSAASDDSYEAALFASGFEGGKFGLPVVTCGMKAWWGAGPDELVAGVLQAVGGEAAGRSPKGASTPAGSAATAVRSLSGAGAGAGGREQPQPPATPSTNNPRGGAHKMEARIKELESELAASRAREAKLEARIAELEGGGGAGTGAGGANETTRKPGQDPVLVYGRQNCKATQAVQRELAKNGIQCEVVDMDKDQSYREALKASGFSGSKPPPTVVCRGDKAFWEEPDEGIAVHFPSMMVNEMRKLGLGPAPQADLHVTRDVTLDTEIAERFRSMQEAFLKCDANRDGRVSKAELRKLCQNWNIPTSEAERIMGEGDVDASGNLDFNEFARRFRMVH